MKRRQPKLPTHAEMRMQAERYYAFFRKHETTVKVIGWVIILALDMIGIFALWVFITNRWR